MPEVEVVGAGEGVVFDGGDGDGIEGEEARQREQQEGRQKVGLAVQVHECLPWEVVWDRLEEFHLSK